MAELVDAQASGACGSNVVWVQVPSSALFDEKKEKGNASLREGFFFCLLELINKRAFPKKGNARLFFILLEKNAWAYCNGLYVSIPEGEISNHLDSGTCSCHHGLFYSFWILIKKTR